MIKWNGINLRDYGIIVEERPNIVKGKKRMETYQIDGRSGLLTIDTGTYDSSVLTLSCHCTSDSNLNEIKAKLDGYGTLTLQDEGFGQGVSQYRDYNGFISNQIDFSKVLNFKKFALQFTLNPISYDTYTTTVENIISGKNINLTSTYKTAPKITLEVEGDATITFNNQSFMLTEANGRYVLDCENKTIIDENEENSSFIMSGDFPILIPGNNEIRFVGTITSFKVEYKRAWI